MSHANFNHIYLGVKLFHEGRFHEAHEEAEKFWQNYHKADRCLYQAFIQICACLHLINEKRYAGAKKVLERARKNIFRNVLRVHEGDEDGENTENVVVQWSLQNLNQLSEFKKFIDLEKTFLKTEVLLNEHLSATDFKI
jgi:hypothetical protein